MKGISSNDNSVDDMLARLQKKLETTKITTQRDNVKKSYSTSAKKLNLTSYMTRIANAKTSTQVDSVIRLAQAEALFMKSRGANNQEVSAANQIARKIKEKGTTKIYLLRKESDLKRLSDIQKNAKNALKAEETLKELKRRQHSRKAKERLDVVNSTTLSKTENEYAPPNTNVTNTGVNVTVEISGNEFSLIDTTSSDMGGIDCLL